jgi:hypothetical protein
MLKVILVLIAAVLAWAAYSVSRENDARLAATPTKAIAPDMSPAANEAARKRWAEIDRLEQIRNIKLEKWSWKKGGFDNVMIGTFTIQNANDFGIKDVVISCEHFAPSGTLIDRNTKTVYQAVKAKSSITIKDFNMGLLHTQAAKSSCTVKDFV